MASNLEEMVPKVEKEIREEEGKGIQGTNQKSRQTVLTGHAELYHGGEETAGPEKVEDKMDASACQAEEFGLSLVWYKSNCFFLTCRQLIEQEVLIMWVQSGKPNSTIVLVNLICFAASVGKISQLSVAFSYK